MAKRPWFGSQSVPTRKPAPCSRMAGSAAATMRTTITTTKRRMSAAPIWQARRKAASAKRWPAVGSCVTAATSALAADVRERRLHLLCHRLRQRDVAQRLRVLLAFGDAVAEEVHQRVVLLLIAVLPVGEDPGEGDDGVRVLRLGVGRPDDHVLGQRGRGERGLPRGGAGLDVRAGLVLERGHRQLLAAGVAELDVADGAGRALDAGGDALVALGARSGRPVGHVVDADALAEL